MLTLTAQAVETQSLRGGEPAQHLVVDVTGWETLDLMATGYSWGQAAWCEPILQKSDGKTVRVADLTPAAVQVGWGSFSVNKGPDGKPLSVGGRQFTHGIFAHADSHVTYVLDGAYTRFEAWVGVNHTAEKRGRVVFAVRDDRDFQQRQVWEKLRRMFTREALAKLQRSLAKDGERMAELRRRLGEFERDFDELRRGLENDPKTVHARLEAFQALVGEIHRAKLTAPLLFVKHHPYFAAHIYDDHLTWHPGGGIHIIENPWAPMEQQIVRPVIDPTTKETLGEGVYRDPDISFDGKRMLFAFKGEAKGDTSIYEIGLDGTGLRRLTNPSRDGVCRERPTGLIGEGGHDYSPCYLPDGRIVFVSTRTAGLVMCFNNHIATLHTMNADGSDLKTISVNNVTEFDPAMLPDGRVLYGRWEYVDKTALYIQSIWTVNPDGSQETALFKNNLAKPTAVLDARPVPGSDLICASLTPHNGQSVGAIAMINLKLGKNNLAAITNFTPEYPTEMDQGLRRGPCDPCPLDEDFVLIANNAENHGPHGVIEMIDRFGFRTVIRREPDISCYSPMPIQPHRLPPVIPSMIKPREPAKFFVHDVYQGLDGVKRGEVKQLRVLETTSRVSGLPAGGRWWNQAFLVSWQGSYDVKNVLGVVPVEADGSAYFEAPPGKAIYLQALDKHGRLIQSMRTFVQAVPGVTRSCQGCHIKDDNIAPVSFSARPQAMARAASQIKSESWGRGFLDYPTMVQPVLDRNCVPCHGGEKGIAGGLDFNGGWTRAFNISYETFIKNTLAGFLNCHNSSVHTAEILPPRTHGSAAARLAEMLLKDHAKLTTAERDLLLAWMDGNCNYYGTWNYTEHATCNVILKTGEQLTAEMQKAGCIKCHQPVIGNDWINLQTPERSRILRAPLARVEGGLGLAWCRDRKAQPIRVPLVTQKIQPPDVFRPARDAAPDHNGNVVTLFSNMQNAAYQSFLAIIVKGREEALKTPRVDMPGAQAIPGKCRELPPLTPPMLHAAK